MVERFNGRIVSEVLALTVYSHAQLEQLLRGFNAAYNARRQRVLEGQTPDQVVAERLTAKPALVKARPSGRAGPEDIIKARLIAESAKEVSQPADTKHYLGSFARVAEATRQGGENVTSDDFRAESYSRFREFENSRNRKIRNSLSFISLSSAARLN